MCKVIDLKNRNVIRISDRIADLTGIGLEYLVDKSSPNEIRAIFFDGMFITAAPSVDVDADTLTAA